MRFEAVLCNDPTTVRQEARLEKRGFDAACLLEAPPVYGGLHAWRPLASSASTNALPKGR